MPDNDYGRRDPTSAASASTMIRLRQRVELDDGPIHSVTFSPDAVLVAGGGSRSVNLIETASGRRGRRLDGHTEAISSVAFSPDGAQIAAAAKDKTVRLWEVETGKSLQVLTGHPNPV